MIIIVNSKVSGTNIQGALGKPEYSYYFLLRQFLPALDGADRSGHYNLVVPKVNLKRIETRKYI
ncbi:hypothetical protein VF673_14145 [Halopseudomonas sp. Lyrl_26]|uniref:hypothetical protein n=1 Tax=Halopseudomonas sp. Lyrl_26 TaxID=3110923 RepID=UPI003F7FBDCD